MTRTSAAAVAAAGGGGGMGPPTRVVHRGCWLLVGLGMGLIGPAGAGCCCSPFGGGVGGFERV